MICREAALQLQADHDYRYLLVPVDIRHFVLKCLMFLYSIVLSARKRLLAVAIIRPETVWALDTREQMQREIALAHLRLGLPDQFHQ